MPMPADSVVKSVKSAVKSAKTPAELVQIYIKYLGRSGEFTGLLRSLSDLAKSERAAAGQQLNKTKAELEQLFASAKVELGKLNTLNKLDTLAGGQTKGEAGGNYTENSIKSAKSGSAQSAFSSIDVTLPGKTSIVRHRHLINQITDEIIDIFARLGYDLAPGREIETDWYNFTALNTPPDHPAKAPQDTFYLRRDGKEDEFLLRTQTSPAQIHALEELDLPIYVLSPGKVYRRDVPDPSHLPQFTQVEGLVVDRGITFAHLKGTLEHFVKAMFGADRASRFRPHYFPFTEPSAEVDIACGICGGTGQVKGVTGVDENCRFCKGTGWQEILGCGMVDPNVYEMLQIDDKVYSGFAFGLGVERIAALKYNVPDLRLLLEGDVRFLHQF